MATQITEREARRVAEEAREGEWRLPSFGRDLFLGRLRLAISAAVVYADTLRREHPQRSAEATELADLFCRQARRRAEALFDALFDNDDVDAYTLAQGVLGGRFTWLEEGIVDPAG